MKTRLTPAPLALLACAALLAAGCGSDGEGEGIPPEQASALARQLDSIESRFDAGGAACRDIVQGTDTNRDVVQRTLDSLPADVDAGVRDAVRESFDHLWELAQTECADEPEPETTPTETVPPPETAPTETEMQETETQPLEPEPEDEGKKDKREKRDRGDKRGDGGGSDGPPDGGGGGAVAPEDD